MAPSEDPGRSERGHRRASPQSPGLEMDADPGPGGKLVCRQKAVPPAHLTFVIDCARGKQIPLAAPPALCRAASPRQGPVTRPMKTYIMFFGDSWAQPPREDPPGQGCLAQVGLTPPPPRGPVAPASFPDSPLCPQEPPKAKGGSVKPVPVRSSAWGTVKGSLKALSSCVCGLAD
ncbi:steroid receptor-associated and regulated protein [Dasypus novemcinctus]|uniref:steroid receptor-associated and regulated protein n=1 Tax=Dasypus novemcinctus TaxID=9361 RepID=UPI0003288679|nr:steroid receptor-associated and regulated protein [Dasypus novemcinctus]